MRYVSTRGGCPPLAFVDAVLAGLAPDGGLLVPASLPLVADQLPAWRRLSYTELAQQLFRLYADDIHGDDLDAIVAEAFAAFDHPQVAPLRTFGDLRVLELFHGPTLSFKDVALQALGRLLATILARRGERLNVVVATSGDTGSAAIHGLRGRDGLSIFVLYPKGRVSPLQELQMTTVRDANVHCLAIDGSFDDCQAMVKAMLSDASFKARHALGAVNSINWARVVAQMSYYVYALLQVGGRAAFAVPTGNFGNIFSAMMVREMGVPIEKLVLATNENDILARFFQTGVYRRGPVRQTISPSMDIQVASNFERFLHWRLGRDPKRVTAFMRRFREAGEASLPDGQAADAGVVPVAVDTGQTLATIADVHQRHGYVVDPHTAVAVAAGRRLRQSSAPLICLAAAHPAKFPEAVAQALGDAVEVRHPALDRLAASSSRRSELPVDLDAVKAYVGGHAI